MRPETLIGASAETKPKTQNHLLAGGGAGAAPEGHSIVRARVAWRGAAAGASRIWGIVF
jgi:hypothetical protein